jgi:ATP-dependent RNA helicase SUPV3L1/SUV3
MKFQKRSKYTKRSSGGKFILTPNEMIPTKDSQKYLFAATHLDKILNNLESSKFVWKRCQSFGITKDTFSQAIHGFKVSLRKDEIIRDFFLGVDFHENISKQLIRKIQIQYPQELQDVSNKLLSLSDLRSPVKWYPFARKMKRRIIAHLGPTNSGKTHQALKIFEKQKSGIYCGPLRLLAHEIYERCNLNGVDCNLKTGEETKEKPGVNRWAVTVEMANLNRKYDIAIIDEIQMISDPDRGWAWTQAFLGIQADEIYVCGEPSAEAILRQLCELTGEELMVKRHTRLTPLSVDSKSLRGNLKQLKPGDCVITFSRKGIYKLKNKIEKETPYSACVIYGSLPPGILL